jgi:hypothetical protein
MERRKQDAGDMILLDSMPSPMKLLQPSDESLVEKISSTLPNTIYRNSEDQVD